MLDGWAASQGIDPMTLPIDRLLNLVYFWMIDGKNEKKRADIDRQLDRPVEGEERDVDDGAWSADAEMAAFQKASAATST